MSMIWNTDPVGHCLVFPSLQITKSTVVFYLVASELARGLPATETFQPISAY
jgi:hypothetical protein